MIIMVCKNGGRIRLGVPDHSLIWLIAISCTPWTQNSRIYIQQTMLTIWTLLQGPSRLQLLSRIRSHMWRVVPSKPYRWKHGYGFLSVAAICEQNSSVECGVLHQSNSKDKKAVGWHSFHWGRPRLNVIYVDFWLIPTFDRSKSTNITNITQLKVHTQLPTVFNSFGYENIPWIPCYPCDQRSNL